MLHTPFIWQICNTSLGEKLRRGAWVTHSSLWAAQAHRPHYLSTSAPPAHGHAPSARSRHMLCQSGASSMTQHTEVRAIRCGTFQRPCALIDAKLITQSAATVRARASPYSLATDRTLLLSFCFLVPCPPVHTPDLAPARPLARRRALCCGPPVCSHGWCFVLSYPRSADRQCVMPWT